MNTVTQTETLAKSAVAAAAALSTAAIPIESVTVPGVAPYEQHLIPLSRLLPSSRNVRQSGGTANPELAASIARVCLLQNLTVITLGCCRFQRHLVKEEDETRGGSRRDATSHRSMYRRIQSS